MDNLANLYNLSFALLNQKGIGSATFVKLLDLANSIQNLYDLNFDTSLINKELINKIENSKEINEDFIELLENKNIGFVFCWEDRYPELLKHINDYPAVLYYKGNYSKDTLENCVAVVGTRNNTSYGSKWTSKICEDLTQKEITIVSGMAMGIDAIAHTSALNSKGKTIAVLGSPVDQPTPTINSKIYNRIIENNGLVVSEYAPGTKIVPGMFANRNRIVAGLSKAVLVIEADEKSGALITANLAFDYNREVFALPGNIENKFSSGCNKIIKEDKAVLLTSSNDVLLSLGFEKTLQNKSLNQDLNLTKDEQNVYDHLFKRPMFIDEIASVTKLSVTTLLKLCINLELKGLIGKDSGGRLGVRG